MLAYFANDKMVSRLGFCRGDFRQGLELRGVHKSCLLFVFSVASCSRYHFSDIITSARVGESLKSHACTVRQFKDNSVHVG